MKNKIIQPAFFREVLFAWYGQNGRDLPWRKTIDPYRIWVSEVMLQQTQVNRVVFYYDRFLKLFPDVRSLSEAGWQQVLDAWRGLGYYRRARNMHEAAKLIVKNYDGVFPSGFEELKGLPGVGDYTAAAISCFAFGQDIPAIDTNLHKVFRHIIGTERWDGLSAKYRFKLAKKFIGKGNGARFHQAIMDFGTWLSQSGHTHFHCPFEGFCEGIQVGQGRVQRQPMKGRKVAIGLLIHDGKILIALRRAKAPFGGFWEFPGGKVEAGEDERSCLKREMQEELGVEVSVRPPFSRKIWEQDGVRYLLSFHRCSLLFGEPEARAADEFRWVTLKELPRYRFPPATIEILPVLEQKKGMFRV